MPQSASSSTSPTTTSAVSAAPRARSCSTRGASVRRSASRIALDPSASPIRRVKTRSARFTAIFLRETTKRGPMRRIHGIELRAERGEGGVAELGHEPAREVTRETRAMLVARVRGTVDVGFAFACALEEALVVEADHDRHDGRVGELACPREILDDVADRRRTSFPEPRHDLCLERTEELLLGLLRPAKATKVGLAHPLIIPRRPRTVTRRRCRRKRGCRSERPSRPCASATL